MILSAGFSVEKPYHSLLFFFFFVCRGGHSSAHDKNLVMLGFPEEKDEVKVLEDQEIGQKNCSEG